MTIAEAQTSYPGIEPDLLLTHILKKPKEFLFLHPEKKLTTRQQQTFQQLARRRLKGEPVAYLVGYKYFCGYKFLVTPHVLIPRPETEWLVEKAAEIVRTKLKNKKARPVRVLDMGTGSGCIAISLANNLRNDARVKITATDISVKALTVAKRNARLHKAKIIFTRGNLFDQLKGRYDLIIANLPYVTAGDYKKLRQALRFEPAIALHDKTNSYALYKRFLRELPGYLAPDAVVLLETDPGSKKVLHLPANHRWHQDLQHLWRYIVIKT